MKLPNKYFTPKVHPVVGHTITRQIKRAQRFKSAMKQMPTHQDAPSGVPSSEFVGPRSVRQRLYPETYASDYKRCRKVQIDRKQRRSMARGAAMLLKRQDRINESKPTIPVRSHA